MNYTLINAIHKEEIRVAVVKNKKLTSLNIETAISQKTRGNIYKGKVSRIEQSLGAAFVDYGKAKQGFLPFKEIAASLYKDITPKKDKLTITDVLKQEQDIIVQVGKEERANKGAALSTYINIAGTYMILTPNNSQIKGISRQITDSTDRQYLKNIIDKITISTNSGLIIRTAGIGKSLDELQWEADYLLGLWDAINKVADKKEGPFLIYKESDIIVRTLRNYLREDTDAVYIDDKHSFEQAKEFVSFVLPDYADKIKFFTNKQYSLFHYMEIEKQINNVFNRKIMLPSGATIVFDTTEALTSIDINSARATKGVDIKETAYKTNLEAVREISSQLRLKDIGGLIVIDFIDMLNEEHKKSIEREMKEATKTDRARIKIGTISQFGLLEISRQRFMSSIMESVVQTCPKCLGAGTVPAMPNLALTIIRQLESEYLTIKNQENTLVVQAATDVIIYLLNEKRDNIVDLENKYMITIILLPNSNLQFPFFTVKKQKNTNQLNSSNYQKKFKQQHNLPKNNLNNIIEKPFISTNKPATKIPNKKISIFQKIKQSLLPNKPPVKNQKTHTKHNNRNKHKMT